MDIEVDDSHGSWKNCEATHSFVKDRGNYTNTSTS